MGYSPFSRGLGGCFNGFKTKVLFYIELFAPLLFVIPDAALAEFSQPATGRESISKDYGIVVPPNRNDAPTLKQKPMYY
jgi:hypothetical protein